MLSLTDLFQQDIFLAVFFYLSAGLVFVLLFLYTEKKWETDLQRYQIQNIAPYLSTQKVIEKKEETEQSKESVDVASEIKIDSIQKDKK